MSLAAGEMVHRLRVEELVQATDPDYGGPVGNPEWKPVAEVWAKRTNTLRATAEALASGTTIAPVQVRFDMRPRALTAAMRLVGVKGDHDGVIYDIQNIGISNDRSEMAVLCTSGATHG